MSSERTGEPLPGATYNGFSGPTAEPVARPPMGEPAPAARVVHAGPAIPRNAIIGGVAAAVALGLAFGLWARLPSAKAHDTDSAKAEAATAPSVPIEVAAATPPAAVRPAGPLEVLPADLAQSARASAPTVVRVAPRAAAPGDYGSNAAAIAPRMPEPAIEDDLPPPEERMTRAERRELRAERRAMMREQGEPLREPRFLPPQPEDDEDDPGDAGY